MAFSVTLKNLGAFAAASNLQLFLRKTSDNSLLNAGGDTGSDASSIGSFTWTVAEDRPAEQLLARIYEGETETAANIVIDSVLNVGFTEIGQEAAALDTEGQAMIAAFNAMRSGNVFTAPALANAPGGLTAGQQLQLNSVEAKTNLITSSTRITIAADSGSSITLKCGDDYAGSTAKRIEITDADSSLYNLLRDETLTARAFGAGIRRDAVTGTFSRDATTHTAASGSIPAYTTIFIECSVASDTPAGVTTYDIQITDASGRRHTPFSGQCTLVQDYKS